MSTWQIQNMRKQLLPINLDGLDEKKKRKSLILGPREWSRELSDEEFESKEIKELLMIKPRSPIRVKKLTE